MTINNNSSKHQRITELFDLCRQRYLEAGGNPHKSVDCQQWMSEAEKQELLRTINTTELDFPQDKSIICQIIFM